MESVLIYQKLLFICLTAFCFLGYGGMEAATPPPAPAYSFSLVPKGIKMRGNHTEITLSLVLMSACKGSKVELEARSKNGATHFRYSKALKKFIKDLNLKRSDLRPFERYLKRQIKNALKNPNAFIGMLAFHLQDGGPSGFTLDL